MSLRIAALVGALFCALPVVGCAPQADDGHDDAATASALALLPKAEDWIDVGLVIDTGSFGSWDTMMEGITPIAVIQREGTFFLYYVGAPDYITDLENIGPADRAIGVALSGDGIRWEKSRENPVLSYSSTGNPEEGAVSGGVFVDGEGNFVAYYGANIGVDPTGPNVNADVHRAISADGVHFQSLGKVIDHADDSVWGSGDEIHSTAALRHGDTTYVYYVPNGSPERGLLGFCRGEDPASLLDCGPVRDASGVVPSRGSSSVVQLESNLYVFFVSNRGKLNAYLVDGDRLDAFPNPSRSYEIGSGAVCTLDRERRSWLLYFNKWSHLEMKVAPAGPRDETPPSAPERLVARELGHDRSQLDWEAASDPDTGILFYNVYRDGKKLGHTLFSSFRDSLLSASSRYGYEIRAVNLHGVEGPAATITFETPADEASSRSGSEVVGVVSDGLIGRWSMDDVESSGRDASDFGHHAVAFGSPRRAEGLMGRCIELSGGDYLEIAPTVVLDEALRTGFTISAWVRPEDLPPRTDTTNGSYSIVSGPGGLRLQYRFDGVFTAAFGTQGDSNELISQERSPGSWHHLAMAFDAERNALSLFVDGIAAPGSPISAPEIRYEQRWKSPNYIEQYGRYRIGVNNPEFTLERNFFHGALDEIRIHAGVLGESEIRELAEQP